MSDTPPNPLEGLLSNFALGPAWARAKSEPIEKKFKDAGEREFKPRRGGDRRDDFRGGGGGDRGGNRDDRRGGQGGGGRRDFDKGGRGRQDFRREEVAPAEGVTVSLIPEKAAIQLIIKEIHHVARVYPLFDIAQIILAERSRIRAVFEISEKKDPFYRCKLEEAIYLTKEEALSHLLEASWRDRFIAESTIEVDPPKGNFQSVARCGISGEWLGPPNFHAYQTEIRRIHRERFANMPFEAYLSKVRTERGEEAVNAWLDTMRTQTRWRILSDEESAAVAADSIRQAENPPEGREGDPSPSTPDALPNEAPVLEADTAQEPPADSITEKEPVTEDPAAEETSGSPDETGITGEATEEAAVEPEATAELEESPATEPVSTPDHKWYTDRAEFERALASEILEKAFHVTRKAKLSAAIPGKKLSPGLLARLKGTGSHHRKHPAIFIPLICQVLETEHMPVFKRKGKLYTGPARPHALAPDAVLAPRPAEMVTWIRNNNPAKLEGLWKAVLPEGASAPPAEYAADLFWLLQQGHILLYTDDTLVVQEAPKPQEPKKPKQPKKKAAKDTEAKAAAEPGAPATEAAPEVTVPEATAPETTTPEEPPSPEPTASMPSPEAAAPSTEEKEDTEEKPLP